MKKRFFLLFIGIFMSGILTGQSALALTTPYYSFSEIYAYGGAGAVGFSDPDHQTAEGPGVTSLTGGSGPCYGFVPGPGGSSCSWIGPRAVGRAQITSDPANGNIRARTEAEHESGSAGWWVTLPGTNPFFYSPATWGEASAFGYIRSVWQVVSNDLALQPGDPADINANLSVSGFFENDLESGVRAMLMLNRLQDVYWLDFQEYTTWSVVEDLGLMNPLYPYLNTTNETGTSVDYAGGIGFGVSVGDVIVMETLFSIYSFLDNDGILKDTWADFTQTLNSSIHTATAGAVLVPYGAQQSVIPEPSTLVLLGVGVAGIGLAGIRKRLVKKS